MDPVDDYMIQRHRQLLREHLYPVSEIFHSVQGEGAYTGTYMMFVRLAGCNVGVYPKTTDDIPENYQATKVAGIFNVDSKNIHPVSSSVHKDYGTFKILSPKHSFCTSFDGQRFLCDTDYHVLEGKMTPEQIVKQLKEALHICVTGGEPLLHDLNPLADAFPDSIEMFHIETSGTLPLPSSLRIPADMLWITACPKSIAGKSFKDGSGIDVQAVDEWKLIVGPDFKEKTLEEFEDLIPSTCRLRYLQPVNGIHEVWHENLNKCLALLERWPDWRLSSQLHKYLQVR